MADILQDIFTLERAVRSQGKTPKAVLIPHQRIKEFVEMARTKRNQGKLILPVGTAGGENVGISNMLGMQVFISLGDKVFITV